LKRILVILFTLFYLLPAVGVSLDLHKCGKKVKVIEINSPHGAKCPCGTAMPFDCCKDVHLSVKIDDSQKITKSSLSFRLNVFKQFDLPVIIKIGETVTRVNVFDFSSYHAPPFKNKQPVYLINSIFRI
jgi:hypothetical protein